MNYQDFSLGDLITTYHSGYWRLLEIERRYYREADIKYYSSRVNPPKVGEEYSPLLVYEKLLTSDFKPVKGKIVKQCDAAHCRKVTQEAIAKMLKDYTDGCYRLMEFL